MANYSAQYVFGVTADTKAAQTQLQQLSKSLRDIQTKKINLAVDDTRITQAAEAAQLLQHELTKAMNVKTGQLDLSKLSQGLKAANTDVATLGRSLLGAGQQGQQAFSALVGTISAVNAPVKQLSRTITNLGTTLMNTIKWQASSSLVHGLMSTISGAISYARNLNETLNNIQIVTGQSDAQMAKFATTANRMAKELSTTTNEFAKASLIYYQQGDSAELAARKAAITTKAANVAFTASAQEMSEMLTAVWNSFQMGEDELEHAVDVLAKLGATTASSMEEMATGMQKVAATANTVGVSMEQMSAIVATAASVTRQAPQTIGTAWNTILSRIGGLKLGETLEDGVDLNKYSKALQTIGVNILDANGELREMGGVIDDIGSKWENLTTAQQSALAQTIGGARQYTQILAFFDNFDKYQQNMKTAMNADGALQEQADIYAESWEAASNRVRASLETLYSQIFDDKAIAKVTSFFGKLIDLVTTLTSSFGGVGNVISLIATHLIQSHIDVFSTKLVEIGNNIKQVFSGRQEINDYAQQLSNLQQQMRDVQDVGLNNNSLSDATQVELRYDIEILDIKKRIAEQQGSLTKAQLETAEATIKNLEQDKAYYLQIIELQKQMTKNVADSQKNNEIEKMARASAERLGKNYDRMSSSERLNLRQDASKTNIGDYVADLANNATKNIKSKAQTATITKEFQQAESSLQSLAEKFNVFKSDTESLTLDHVNESAAKIGQELGSADQILKQMSTVTFSVDDGNIENLKSSLTNIVDTMSNMTMFNNFGNADFSNLSELQKAINGLSTTSSQEEIDKLQQKINNFVQEAQAAFEDQFVAKFRTAAEKLGIGPEIDKIIADAKRIPVETEAPIDQAANNIKKIKDEYEKSLSGASNSVQTFVNGAMALQRITTSINAVSNAMKTLSDPDVDGMTKLTTVVSTLVTVSMAASSVMNLLKGSTISAAVAAGIKARQDALATAGTVANTAASVAGTAANTGLAVSFHAAAAGAKAFWASLGPLGWVILGLTAVVGLVGGIASAIAAHEKQIAQQKQDAIDTYNGIIEKQQKLTSSYSSLNSILEDTNLTLSEQLTKINEITKAFGLQVTAADLAGESYDGLNNKLLAYAKSSQIQNIEKMEQATETITETDTSYDMQARNNWYDLYDDSVKWFQVFKHFIDDERVETDEDTGSMWDNGLLVYDEAGNPGLTKEDHEALKALGLTVNDIGLFVNELKQGTAVDYLSGVNSGFNYNREQSLIQGEFGLTDAGFEKLVNAGVFVPDTEFNEAWNLEGKNRKFKMNFDSGLTGEDIHKLLNEDIETNVVSGAAEKRINDFEENVKIQRGILEVLNSGKVNFVGSKDDAVSVAQFRDLMNYATTADTYGAKEQVAAYFKDLPVYSEAYAKYTGLGSIAGVVQKSSSNKAGLSQTEILDKLIDYTENSKNVTDENKEITVDTLLTLRPTAIKINTDGEVEIDKSALKLSELTIEADNLEIKASKIAELKGIKSDTLTVEEVQQAKDSGLFTEAELNQFVVSDKNARAAMLDKKEESNNQAIHDNEVQRLAAVKTELQQTKTDLDQMKSSWQNLDTTYSSPTSDKEVRVADQSYENMATDLALARQNRTMYNDAAALKGVEWGKANESQKAAALAVYNHTQGTELTELTEDQYKKITSDTNIDIFTQRAAGMQRVIDTLDPLITEYEGLITVQNNLEQEEQELQSSTEAYDLWEKKVKNIKDAKTAVQQYQSFVGKNGKLTAAELTQLKEMNVELYNQYVNKELTNEAFDDAVYEAQIAKLQELKLAYEAAGQTEEAFVTQQEIETLELEKKTAQLAKAEEAYSRYSAMVKESETKTESMKTGATLLQDNVETGQLTAVQKLQFKQSGLNIDLEAYENATSQTERAAIAAQAWSQYLAQAKSTMELNVAKTQELLNAMGGTDTIMQSLSKSTEKVGDNVDDFILTAFRNCSEEAQGLAKTAYKTLQSEGKITANTTKAEAISILMQYLSEQKSGFVTSFDTIEATGVDTMKSIWDSATAEEAEAARQTISDWESAFKTIASLRQKILSNSVDEITSEEWLQGFLASDYQTAEEYNAALYSKDVNKFELPVLTDDEILTALGITNSWTNGQGKVKNNLTGQQLLDGAKKDNPNSDDTAIREQTAKTVVQALQDNATGLGLQAYDESQLKKEVDAWLTQGNSQILKIGDKEINVSSLLSKSVEAQKGVRDLNVMQNSKAEATTVRDTALENAERLSSQAATNLEEMQNYANAAYDLAKDMGEKTVTETMEGYTMSNADFLSKINEVMGQNYESIEEVPKNILRDFASAMTESQYDSSESPLAQQVEAARQEMEAQQAYIEQQKNINSNYENTTRYEEDIEKLNELTTAYNEAAAAQDKMKDQDYQSYLESLAEDIDLTAKELEDYGNKMVEQGEVAEGLSQKEQAKYAKALYRQVQGFTTAKKNLQSYTDELKESKGDVNAYTKALNNMRSMYADVFDFDENQAKRLSDAFLESAENAKLLEKAAAGDEKALDQLARNAADDFLSITENADNIIDLSGISTTVENEMSSIQEWLDSHNLEAGATLDDSGFIAQCENLINQCARTAQEASDALSAMGVDATIEEHTATVPAEEWIGVQQKGYYEYPVYNSDGSVSIQSIPLESISTDSNGAHTFKYYTIKGAKYKGTGVTHGGSSTPSSGGGGGGGSSKSAKKVQNVKRGVDEKERYHEITEQLERQSKVLERLDKIKSRTFGANKLKAIQDEIDALEQENKLYSEQAKQASVNLEANKKILTSYGATFNDDGTVNYEEYMDKILARYNGAVDRYNNSAQTAGDELALKEAEEIYNEAKKALEDYEEDMDKLEEAQNNFLENQNKISAKILEGIQYKVEVKFDLNDRDIKLLQYFRDKWEDLFQMQDESMRYMTEEALKYENNLKTLGTAMDALNTAYDNGTLNQADYATGMQDVNDKMVEQLNNLLTIKKSIKEAYGNTLSKAKEEIEKYTAVLDHSHSVLEQYISMQQLMGLGADYSGLQKMYQVSYDSSVANVKAAKDYLEVLKNSKEQIEANAAEHGWTEELKQQWADVNTEIQQGEDDLLSYSNQALTDAQNLFNNTMQAIVQDFDEQLFGMKNGLSDLEDDYEYYQEEQARYLSTSKELYEVSKLNRQINDSIADSTTKASKERLKALQEQIKAQSESTRLTEYDVQMMELQYKYALALDDLENAKNAKSTVRLTRDENGNYGYQYTADDDKISESQQKVEDVLQQINELAANRVNEIEQSAVQAEREYRDALLEIASDTTLTLEERQQKMEELTRRYSETMQYNQEQYGNATSALLTNQQYVYDRYGESIIENTGMIQDQMNTSVAAMIEKTASYGTFLQEQLQPGGQIFDALKNYKDNIGIVTNTSGLNSWENMVASSKDFEEANKAAAAELENINSQLGDTLTNISDVTDQWLDHADVLDSVISKYEELAKASANAVRAAAGNMDGESPEATSGAATKEELENTEKQWMYQWSYNGYSGTWSGYDSRKAALKGAKSDIYQKIMSSLEAGDTDEETASNKAKLQDEINAALQTIEVTQYLSGGLIDYTGPAWVDGSLGRPEMILNADDTQKMMNIVDTLHDLDAGVINDLYHSVVDSAMSYLYALSSLTPGTVNTQSGELQQNVHIEADFPNVTDRNEIVDAFNDLVNMASQYANRR